MHCTNCGQELSAGASICPSCGAPVVSTPGPDISPTPYVPPISAPPPPTSSGASIASLVLGILGILLMVLTIVLSYTLGANIVARFGENLQATQDEILRLVEDPAFRSHVMGIAVCFFGGMLFALIGFILGIVGIAQEGKRPTQTGKALGIVGLVLSVLPLLCCVSVFVIGFIGQ
jgi:hypothetical protein